MLYLRFFVFNLAESTQVKMVSRCLRLQTVQPVEKESESQIYKQTRQATKKRGLSEVLGFTRFFCFMTFKGSFKSMLCLWFATVLTTSFNGLFSNFAERRESVMKCSLLHSRFQCHHGMLLSTNGCLELNHIPFPLCLQSNEQTNHV